MTLRALLLSCCASLFNAASTAQEPAPQARASLAIPRTLVAESTAARRQGDTAIAAAKASEAVKQLLDLPEPEQDAAWLGLLEAAGQAALRAADDRTAQIAWQRVCAMHEATLPEDHVRLQAARGNLSLALSALGDLAGAQALQENMLEVATRTLPDDNYNLQAARLNLASTLAMRGRFDAARSLQEQVLEVFSRTLPDEHPQLQMVRGNLASTYRHLGDVARSRALEEQVLAIFSRTLPSDALELQFARLNLASTLTIHGELDAARDLQEQVLEVYARQLPDDHPELQKARGNLATTLRQLGDLVSARAWFDRVLEAYAHTLPEGHPDLQAARNNVAVTLLDLGDVAGARVLQEQVLDQCSRTLPDDDPHLQVARLNLAATLEELGDRTAAQALEEKVLEVRMRTLPADHPALLRARGNLSGTRRDLGDLESAKTAGEEVLEALARTLPDDHPDVESARVQLATTLNHLGDHAGARVLLERVLDVQSRTLHDEHPRLQDVRASLAMTIAAELAQGRISSTSERALAARSRCVELIAAFARAQAAAARTAILTGSSREAQERCASLEKRLDVCVSFAQGYGVLAAEPELARAAFVLSETARSSALAAAALARRASGAPRYAELRASLRTRSERLSALAREDVTGEEFDRVRRERESAERELAQLARDISGGQDFGAGIDVDRIAATLGAGEAAVAFRRYTKLALTTTALEADLAGARSPREMRVESLCAFVVRDTGADAGGAQARAPSLALVDLGPLAPIEESVHSWRAALGAAPVSRGVPATESPADPAFVQRRGARLREQLLDPLLSAVGGARALVVALDDVLHLVPLDALPFDATACVGDRWRIETRATSSEREHASRSFSSEGALIAFGGVDYGSAGGAGEAARPEAGERARILRGGAWATGFAALPATVDEVRGIERSFADAFGPDAAHEQCDGVRATRERLFELAPRARWLHVATHGWFAPESIPSWSDAPPLDQHTGLGVRTSNEERVRGMSPMLLCGLALAGANLPADAIGRYPGLVTAEEISSWDLSSCELAVLSACDTNVGERRAGQGVASLQKALHMAGARTVITSLWKVPDEATKDLMLDFYRRIWVEKTPKAQALWEAKKRMRDAKDDRGAPKYSTRDWAAWVLTGDPR